MTRYGYPTSAMMGDYLRSAAGLVPSAAMLASLPLGAVAATVLGAFAALFALFGIRTALRHGTHVEMTKSAVRASGLLHASIPWGELDEMKLAYYSTRRDRRGGWMQLKLRSGGSTLRLDSRIAGFAELVESSARAAETRCLPLDVATLANLQALGVKLRSSELGRQEAAGGAA
jgi:hypothetical protein